LLALTGQVEGGGDMASQLMLPPRVNTSQLSSLLLCWWWFYITAYVSILSVGLQKVDVVREPSVTIMVRSIDPKDAVENEQQPERGCNAYSVKL
jgi:hypothetical protein